DHRLAHWAVSVLLVAWFPSLLSAVLLNSFDPASRQPPVEMVTPAMKGARSLHRQSAAAATSSGRLSRHIGSVSSKGSASTWARGVRNDHPKDPAVAPQSLARRWNSRKNHRQFTGRIRAFLFWCGLKGFDLEWNPPGIGHRLARPAGPSVRLGPNRQDPL